MKQLAAYGKELIRGRARLQRFFLLLYKISLAGMNFGGGAVAGHSGEENVIDYVSRKLPLPAPLVIFDVGAHVGNYSIMLLASLSHRKTKIHAFEPSAITFQKLRTNLKDRGVFLHPFGFSDDNKEIKLFYDYDTSVYASVYQRRLDYIGITMDISETVKMKTIDEFCRENNISHIHFLKMDIEGHELSALKGARDMLKGKIDFIQFEFSGANVDSRTYFKDFFYLLKENYNIYRILRNGLYLIRKYNEIHEVFFTTNYLAERKDILKRIFYKNQIYVKNHLY